jgi:hypothetical protein
MSNVVRFVPRPDLSQNDASASPPSLTGFKGEFGEVLIVQEDDGGARLTVRRRMSHATALKVLELLFGPQAADPVNSETDALVSGAGERGKTYPFNGESRGGAKRSC